MVADGEHAIAFLQEHKPPKIVLLDLKLPGIDGFEVLKWIRSQSEFAKLPVVVLTSSTEIKDANRAYQLGANSFLIKPLEVANVDAVCATLHKHGFFERAA